MWDGPLEKIDDYRFRIPKSYKPGMLVDGVVYADEYLLKSIKADQALEQVANAAFLPGIVGNSLAMPDIHWGYGFCIGAVAATDPANGGVISPGGVGFDINCGVRMLRSNLTLDDLKDKASALADVIYATIPSGVGSRGDIRLSSSEEKKLLVKGAGYIVEKGMGTREDLESCEEEGAIDGADPDCVSPRALDRGKDQSGTLGSGNHFVEVQVITDIYDAAQAREFGLEVGSITAMIHSGSRGLGYQVCEEYSRLMLECLAKYGINVPDRQLACAPVDSPQGRQYLGAMRAAANYAWANRQALTHLLRLSFEKVFKAGWQNLGLALIYDVAHNIAKLEEQRVNGQVKLLCVHRKGATRAFNGQPVIIPGDMGRASYLLLGTKKAELETFGTVCHGAGRLSSRGQALRTIDFAELSGELKSRGVEVRAHNKRSLIEEAPQVYKNVDDVVNVVDKAGLSRKVCRMRPVVVIKG
jgi:tRNA-splicing ligase RtcB